MDGKILDDNLKRMGLDTTWLQRQLEKQNIHSSKEVFLGICDKNNKLTVYKRE